MKVLKTNWINILGVLVTVYVYAMIVNSRAMPEYDLLQLIVSAGILVCLYGAMFWALFIISLLVLDLLLITRVQTQVKARLLLEWLIISLPFLYWTFKYGEWIFLVSIIAFLITQLIRERYIPNQKPNLTA